MTDNTLIKAARYLRDNDPLAQRSPNSPPNFEVLAGDILTLVDNIIVIYKYCHICTTYGYSSKDDCQINTQMHVYPKEKAYNALLPLVLT